MAAWPLCGSACPPRGTPVAVRFAGLISAGLGRRTVRVNSADAVTAEPGHLAPAVLRYEPRCSSRHVPLRVTSIGTRFWQAAQTAVSGCCMLSAYHAWCPLLAWSQGMLWLGGLRTTWAVEAAHAEPHDMLIWLPPRAAEALRRRTAARPTARLTVVFHADVAARQHPRCALSACGRTSGAWPRAGGRSRPDSQRARRSACDCSHQGVPRSPCAVLVRWTLARATAWATRSFARGAAPTARRAAINCRRSAAATSSGRSWSVARQRRPSTTTTYRPSGCALRLGPTPSDDAASRNLIVWQNVDPRVTNQALAFGTSGRASGPFRGFNLCTARQVPARARWLSVLVLP